MFVFHFNDNFVNNINNLFCLFLFVEIGQPEKLEKRHLSAVPLLRSVLPLNTSIVSNHSYYNRKDPEIERSSLPLTIPATASFTKNVQLIIVTRWRSGSSFTGEIFNNNPEFAYFFEPLIGTVGSKSGIPFGEHHVSVLHDILKCNFIKTNYMWWQGQIPINCGKSLTFSKTILCEYFKVVLQPRNDTSAVVEEACRSHRHVAIKTVRMPDIKYLKRIVSDSNLNVKIIHLIRDPRAVFLSRASTPDVDDMHHDECDEMENNLNYWKNTPNWLKGHHMLLRYEDLAEDPVSLTEKIYSFLGLKVPETVKMWLRYNTNWNEVGQFSHARVSSEAAHAWRTKIPYRTMLEVQRRCIVPLLMAGYKPITSQKDLSNFSVPTLTKFSYPLRANVTELDNIWDESEDSSVGLSSEQSDNIKDNFDVNVHHIQVQVPVV